MPTEQNQHSSEKRHNMFRECPLALFLNKHKYKVNKQKRAKKGSRKSQTTA